MSSSLKDGWNKISQNYQRKAKIPTNDIYWGDFVACESQLGVLGPVSGRKVLEIGCGGAQNCIVLSRWGAEPFGIDLSKKQVLYGLQLAENKGANADLLVGNMEELPFKNEAFDLVLTAVSLLYVPDLVSAVSEVNRILRKGGYFTFSTPHPLAEGNLVKYRGRNAVAVRNYFKRRIIHWTDKLPDCSKVRMHSYYRTLQDYFDVLVQNGFVVERYIELEPLEENALPTLDQEELASNRGAKRLYKIMKEVPYWIIFKSRKIP